MSDVHDAQRLMELQRLPLDRKIQITQTRIIEFYQHYQGQVCISFSGGKDSTVLLHIARQLSSWGRVEYEHTRTNFLLLKIPWQLLGNNFPQDGVDIAS